jgi:hypothetical protein
MARCLAEDGALPCHPAQLESASNAAIVTIYSTLIAHGDFPKELPPSLFTEVFAKYAMTKNGRKTLENYKPADNFTESVSRRAFGRFFWLAL